MSDTRIIGTSHMPYYYADITSQNMIPSLNYQDVNILTRQKPVETLVYYKTRSNPVYQAIGVNTNVKTNVVEFPSGVLKEISRTDDSVDYKTAHEEQWINSTNNNRSYLISAYSSELKQYEGY